jgi:hypothetical protein
MSSDFDDIIEGLDMDIVTSPATPALDALLDWELTDEKLAVTGVTTAAHLLDLLLAHAGGQTTEPTGRFDVPEHDVRNDIIALHSDDLRTQRDLGLAASRDLLRGTLTAAGLFDAARGFQELRLHLAARPKDVTEMFDDETIDILMGCAAGLSEDLLTLATR